MGFSTKIKVKVSNLVNNSNAIMNRI